MTEPTTKEPGYSILTNRTLTSFDQIAFYKQETGSKNYQSTRKANFLIEQKHKQPTAASIHNMLCSKHSMAAKYPALQFYFHQNRLQQPTKISLTFTVVNWWTKICRLLLLSYDIKYIYYKGTNIIYIHEIIGMNVCCVVMCLVNGRVWNAI